ncbi:hypothetical protein PoB_001226400 [Plakobranchus ocellatus]|uniref:Transformer n=1 Tax=Plakobranchus ocellatus TaxID=259542 RepID=A0AAV3YUP6_9GAST|nr:hypothetical protein PoB_001226400 [Plakobranchus ocellatus]
MAQRKKQSAMEGQESQLVSGEAGKTLNATDALVREDITTEKISPPPTFMPKSSRRLSRQTCGGKNIHTGTDKIIVIAYLPGAGMHIRTQERPQLPQTQPLKQTENRRHQPVLLHNSQSNRGTPAHAL